MKFHYVCHEYPGRSHSVVIENAIEVDDVGRDGKRWVFQCPHCHKEHFRPAGTTVGKLKELLSQFSDDVEVQIRFSVRSTYGNSDTYEQSIRRVKTGGYDNDETSVFIRDYFS